MKDYIYPKVPNYYHESVNNTVFTAEDLAVIEKLDGSNSKVVLYDDRYRELYGKDIHEYNPDDGDVFISSKKRVRGRLTDPVNDFDDAFTRLVHSLRKRLDKDAIREFHDLYDSPLVLYGEHMLQHTLDYEYEENPPPAFIGFDVLQMTEHSEPPANPFKERFDAFLSLKNAYDVFTASGLETAPVVEHESERIDPETLTIPESQYANVDAEGVVIRSDSQNRRVKRVNQDFRERMRESWGLNESDAESGAELFCARYLTNARLRKTVNKILYSHGRDAVTPSMIAEAAVADAWEEEVADIQTIELELVPEDVYPIAEQRGETILDTMETNAALNNTTLDQLWREHGEPDEEGISLLRENPVDTKKITSSVRDVDNAERALVEALIPAAYIHDAADEIAEERDQEIGRWVITDVCNALDDRIWYESIHIVANLPIGFVPRKVHDALTSYVTEVIENRDDVVIDEKPETWDPDLNEVDASGFDSIF